MSTPSVERTVRSRLLPKLSVRSVMLTVTGAAFLAWLGRLAWQGHPLPASVIYALVGLAAFFVASCILFLIAWIPARLMRHLQSDARQGSPFAAGQLPPQILPPREEGVR